MMTIEYAMVTLLDFEQVLSVDAVGAVDVAAVAVDVAAVAVDEKDERVRQAHRQPHLL